MFSAQFYLHVYEPEAKYDSTKVVSKLRVHLKNFRTNPGVVFFYAEFALWFSSFKKSFTYRNRLSRFLYDSIVRIFRDNDE